MFRDLLKDYKDNEYVYIIEGCLNVFVSKKPASSKPCSICGDYNYDICSGYVKHIKSARNLEDLKRIQYGTKKECKKVILGTGSYATVKGGNTVSITGDGGNAWNYFGPSYKKLAPKLVTYTPYKEKLEKLKELKNDALKVKEYFEYRKQIEDEYIKSYYETRLKELDAYELIDTLKEKFGNGIILLCHENVEEFCHRRLVADYIELNTGIYIPEVSVDKKGFVKTILPIRYKNRLKELI